MRKWITYLPLILWVLAATACSSNQEEMQNAEQQLANEVMDIHDEVMPKMAEVNRLSRQLRGYYEEHKAEISTALDGQMELIQRELDQADDGMMAWMANFQMPQALRESQSHKEIMDYLTQQKQEIETVRDQINRSIENAKKLVADLPATESNNQ